MKCMSCQEEINSKWGNAIKTNICPWCGSAIMDENLKALLSGLSDIMENMKQYPDHLNDWLLSNYSYIKTDSNELHKYVGKQLNNNRAKKASTIEDDNDFLISKLPDDRTNDFFKRADLIKPKIDGFLTIEEKTNHIRALAKKIQSEGNELSEVDEVEDDEYVDDDEVIDDESSDMFPAENESKKIKTSSNAAELLKLQSFKDKQKKSLEALKSGLGKFSRA